MKRFRFAAVLLAALALLFALSHTAFAEEAAPYITIENDTKVIVALPLVDRQSATALQFSLTVAPPDGVSPTLRFDTDFRVQETRYDAGTHTLRVYLADDDLLFSSQTETLAVGSLSGAGRVTPQQDSLKLSGSGSTPHAPTGPPAADSGSQPAPGPDDPSSEVPAPDFSALKDALQQAAQYSQNAYTAESFAALQQAIAQAQALLDRSDATPQEIADALLALQNAIGALTPADTGGAAAPPAVTQKPQSSGRGPGGGASSGAQSQSAVEAKSDSSGSSRSAASFAESGLSEGESNALSSAASSTQGAASAAAPAEPSGSVSLPLLILICVLAIAVLAGVCIFFLLPKMRRGKH